MARFYVIVYLLVYIKCVDICVAANIKMSKYTETNGFTCTTHSNFTDVSSSSSLIQCCQKCASLPSSSCRGVIYDPELPACIGCKWFADGGVPETETEVFFSREVYRLVTDNMIWEQAKDNCEVLGGRLADITTEEEQTFIEEFILPSAVNLYWIGGSRDPNNLNIFLWLDGTSVSAGYVNWFPGQPDGGVYESCMMLYQRQDNTTYTWDDAPCGEFLIGSLCELD